MLVISRDSELGTLCDEITLALTLALAPTLTLILTLTLTLTLILILTLTRRPPMWRRHQSDTPELPYVRLVPYGAAF